MNKFLVIMTFVVIGILPKSGHSNSYTFSLSPIVLPIYTDVNFAFETQVFPSNSLTLLYNKNKKSCHECDDEGEASGSGIGALYRFYFSDPFTSSFYFEIGLTAFKGNAKDTKRNLSKEKNVLEKNLSFGYRNYFNPLFFYEVDGGFLDRGQEIKAGKYTAYKKRSLLLGFSLGIKI